MGIFDRFNRAKPTLQEPKRSSAQVRSLNVGQSSPKKYAGYRGLFSSPNAMTRANLPRAREAARDLAASDGYMIKYLEMLSVYVVGDSGMQYLPQVTNADGTLDTETNDILKAAWNEWCEAASYDGMSSFINLQDMAVKGLGRDGESFFRFIRGNPNKVGNRFGFALHPIDAALVDINYTGYTTPDTVTIMGVEYRGVRPVAYHAWTEFADLGIAAQKRERERIPADEVLHLMDKDYGSEIRGMPWIVAAIPTLFDLYDFERAYLEACIVAASIPLVLENIDPRSDAGAFDTQGAMNQIGETTETTTDTMNGALDVSYQSILEVPSGKKLTAINSTFPNQSYKDTIEAYVAKIAAGLVMSYATFSGNNGNDTSATIRHGSQTERDYWKKIQADVAHGFHKKVFKAWLEQAILSNALPFSMKEFDRLLKCEFKPRGFRSINPTQDLKGFALALDYGLTTRSIIAQELGMNDYEDLLRIKKREMELEARYGVVWVDSGKAPAVTAEPTENTGDTLVNGDSTPSPDVAP
jgi:lambda family phage portal protein